MNNVISDTGFWIANNEDEHYFSPELSRMINDYVKDNKIKTVYDFGCGTGEYLQALRIAYPDISATGFEGQEAVRVFDNVITKDLSEPLILDVADLAISIEVGEHIPKEFEQTFIDNISNNASKHLIISWAIEGQSGLGHVNCQNNPYVIDQFEGRGWKFMPEISKEFRDGFVNRKIWLVSTVMVFTR